MMRRTALFMLVLGLVLTMAGPVAAGPGGRSEGRNVVQRFEDFFGTVYIDSDDGLVALGGPPIEEGCFGQGFDDIASVQELLLPNGGTVLLIKAIDLRMQVFAASSVEEVCGAVVAGTPPEPIATGLVRATVNINQVAPNRTLSVISRSVGQLSTPSGETCHFNALNRVRVTGEDDPETIKQAVNLRC